jgi:hypothetical protein
MSTTSAVTLSNENGPSRSRSYRESRTPAPAAFSGPPVRFSGPVHRVLPSASPERGGPDGLGELAQAREPLPGLLAAG